MVLRVAPVAVRGQPRLVQSLELRSELYCNCYVPPVSVLQVRLSVLAVIITAWNSGTMASRKTVPAPSTQPNAAVP